MTHHFRYFSKISNTQKSRVTHETRQGTEMWRLPPLPKLVLWTPKSPQSPLSPSGYGNNAAFSIPTSIRTVCYYRPVHFLELQRLSSASFFLFCCWKLADAPCKHMASHIPRPPRQELTSDILNTGPLSFMFWPETVSPQELNTPL